MTTPTRTRFAPSPTGSLHVGGVRTALYCLLWARHTGGQFMLRVEDTDRARSTQESRRGILSDLEWVGLAWDEGPGVGGPHGPYLQSERRDHYDRAVAQLVATGKAYEAWETHDELSRERRIAEADKRNFRYRKRDYTDEQLARFREEGRTPVLRLQAPGHDVTVHDRVLGEVVVDAETLDDFVILKADGWPTYHLAVVVDDHDMQIDLILRGQEHMMNTHKHHLLCEALGWTPVTTGHLPLIANPERTKMSKRDKAKAARAAAREAHAAAGHPKGDYTWLSERTGLALDELTLFMGKKRDGVAVADRIAEVLGVELPMVEVLDFRRGGYLPEALLNYLALLGWSPGDDREVMTLAEMTALFTLERITKTAARFDLTKLRWMNSEYMKSLPTDTLMNHLASWLEVWESPLCTLSDAEQRTLIEMYRPRAHTFRDIERLGAFFFRRPTEWVPKAVNKHVHKGGGWSRLVQARDALADVGRWEAATLQSTFTQLCDSSGLGLGKYAQPVRVAITGNGVSAEMYDTLAFLGKDETLGRIAAFLEANPERPVAG